MALPELAPVVLARERTLPLREDLRPLFPDGALRRGWTVSVAGSTRLALGLCAGPSAAGSWCAAVGAPSLGLVAAAEAGVALERFALVPRPGADWPSVAAALLDALDVVVIGQQDRPSGKIARRLSVRARERGSVLVSLGAWEGADVRLTAAAHRYTGIGRGHGALLYHEIDVRAEGRGAAARQRRARVGVA